MMKKIIILILFIGSVWSVSAQRDTVVVDDGWRKDTIRQEKQKADSLGKDTEMIIWDNTVRDRERHESSTYSPKIYHTPVRHRSRSNRFKGHWDGFYFGFVNFAGTDYSRYGDDDFMDLDWANSFTMQFNVMKYSIGLSRRNNFGLVTGIGFDYQRLRFDRNITVRREDGGMLQPVPLTELGVDHSKRSVFKTFYLTVPLLIEWQIPTSLRKSFYVATGPVGGVRLHSKTKIVYTDEDGKKRKKKESGSYGMVPFKADWTFRMGYRGTCIWGSYTLTNMFSKSKGPELHPYAVGIGFTF